MQVQQENDSVLHKFNHIPFVSSSLYSLLSTLYNASEFVSKFEYMQHTAITTIHMTYSHTMGYSIVFTQHIVVVTSSSEFRVQRLEYEYKL